MIFFHPGGHGLFLLGLCLLAPAVMLCIISLLGGATSLRHRGQVEQSDGGLAITGGKPPYAPKQGPLAASDEPEQVAPAQRRAVTDTLTQTHVTPRHAVADGSHAVDETRVEVPAETRVQAPVDQTRIEDRRTF